MNYKESAEIVRNVAEWVGRYEVNCRVFATQEAFDKMYPHFVKEAVMGLDDNRAEEVVAEAHDILAMMYPNRVKR